MAVTEATGDNIRSTEAESPLLDGVVGNSVDSRSRPSVRSKSGCWKSAFYILGVEMAERFAFYGIRSNLVNYLTGPMGQSTATAVVNVNVLNGTADVLPLVGAFVGDAFLGRYRAIVGATLFYAIGLGCLSVSATLHSSNSLDCENAVNHKRCSPSVFHTIFFFSCLYLVALMQAIHRPCLQAFGADQFDDEDEKERKEKASFFNWWNFFLSAGVLIAYSVLNYIQENLSWELGFGIPAIVMLFSLLVFSLGTRTYRFSTNSDEKNPFAGISSIFLKAISTWKAIPSGVLITEVAPRDMRYEGTQVKFLEKALLSYDGLHDHEKACNSSHDFEDAKAIIKLVPLWFSCLGFAIVASQPSTLFTKQGATMDRYITSTFQIPAASLQSLLTMVTILLLPVYDLIFVPMARAISKNSTGITMLQRSGIGVFFSVITMVIAGFVERKRLATALEYGLVDVPKATVPMSILWLVPQYVALGSAFCFAFAGLQEFFYDQVPSKLKSVGVGMYLSIFGAGNFISSFLVSGIEKATRGDGKESWFSDNLNRAHFDYFYWLLAGLSTLSFAAYLYFAKYYVYTKTKNANAL